MPLEDPSLGLFDPVVVDASVAAAHVALVVELPMLVAVARRSRQGFFGDVYGL